MRGTQSRSPLCLEVRQIRYVDGPFNNRDGPLTLVTALGVGVDAVLRRVITTLKGAVRAVNSVEEVVE